MALYEREYAGIDNGIVCLSMSSAKPPTPLLNLTDLLLPESHAFEAVESLLATAVDAKVDSLVFSAARPAALPNPLPTALVPAIIPRVANRSVAT